MSICLLQTTYPHAIDFCKLFSRSSILIHAIWASKMRQIGLQKMPFKTLTNALLKST